MERLITFPRPVQERRPLAFQRLVTKIPLLHIVSSAGPVMGLSTKRTDAENPLVGSSLTFHPKSTLYTNVDKEKEEGELGVVDRGRGKSHTAGPMSQHDPHGQWDLQAPFPLSTLRAMPRYRMQQLRQVYRKKISMAGKRLNG